MLKVLESMSPRQILALMSAGCVAILGFGILYLQNVVGLNPCPMCIVQRYAMILVAIFAAVGAASGNKALQLTGTGLVAVFGVGGAFVAARQTWLQWYPPEIVSCGRDIYGMIETFPLQRVIPMVFRGSGDCTKVDWTFLGGSLANWSFVAFVAVALVSVWLLRRITKRA